MYPFGRRLSAACRVQGKGARSAPGKGCGDASRLVPPRRSLVTVVDMMGTPVFFYCSTRRSKAKEQALIFGKLSDKDKS